MKKLISIILILSMILLYNVNNFQQIKDYIVDELEDKQISDNKVDINQIYNFKRINIGGLTSLSDNDSTIINLTDGYVYFISYIVSANVGANSYFQIAPFIDNIFEFSYNTTATSNSASNGNATVSAGFIVQAKKEDTSLTMPFYLKFTTNSTDIGEVTGSVSIFPFAIL